MLSVFVGEFDTNNETELRRVNQKQAQIVSLLRKSNYFACTVLS